MSLGVERLRPLLGFLVDHSRLVCRRPGELAHPSRSIEMKGICFHKALPSLVEPPILCEAKTANPVWLQTAVGRLDRHRVLTGRVF